MHVNRQPVSAPPPQQLKQLCGNYAGVDENKFLASLEFMMRSNRGGHPGKVK
jgi:hypothetical protein